MKKICVITLSFVCIIFIFVSACTKKEQPVPTNLQLLYKEGKYELCIKEADKMYQNTDTRIYAMFWMGKAYFALGELDKSANIWLNIRKIYEEQKNKSFTYEYMYSYNRLGLIYAAQKKFEEAEKMSLHSVELFKKNNGSTNINFGWFLFDLATVYDEMGQTTKARQYFDEALLIVKTIVGQDNEAYIEMVKELPEQYR